MISAVSGPGVQMTTSDTATNAPRFWNTQEVSRAPRALSQTVNDGAGRLARTVVGYRRPVAERTLSQRELNRALLARQLLLERARLPIPRALERIGGIQDQYAPNAYIRLWSCLEGFRRDDLTRALERRSVVQATLMRSTIHVVSRRDYWPFAVAIRASQRDWWLRTRRPRPDETRPRAAGDRAPRPHGRRPTPARGDRRGGRPQLGSRRAVARARSGSSVGHVGEAPRASLPDRRALGRTGGRRAGAKRSSTSSVATSARSVPRRAPTSRSGRACASPTSHLHSSACRYGAFATSRVASCSTCRARRCRIPETPAPVRFLPTWDAMLLVHARRAGVLPEEYRPRIFSTKMPQSIGTFLVDGAVAGTWRYADGHVRWEAFERLDRATTREIDDEAERLAEFHA